MSWRGLVLAGVVGLAFALVLPSVRVYLDQKSELNDLRAQRDAAQAEVDDLTAEQARWSDPAFIVAQARERLAYVFPGETPYRVVDPEYVLNAAAGSPAAGQTGPELQSGPWYELLWSSVVDVGSSPSAPTSSTQPEQATEGEQLTSVDFGG